MIQQTQDLIKSSAETAVGVGLILTPYWAQLLTDIGIIAAVIAQIAGAVIGAIGVYKMLQSLRGS